MIYVGTSLESTPVDGIARNAESYAYSCGQDGATQSVITMPEGSDLFSDLVPYDCGGNWLHRNDTHVRKKIRTNESPSNQPFIVKSSLSIPGYYLNIQVYFPFVSSFSIYQNMTIFQCR